jgi:uncharacterized YigZ family protein
MTRYHIPAATVRIEHEVSRSRFIATLAFADTVDDARAFLASIRAEFADASHHPYAFKVGYGSSVIEGVSDDGEPTGTSGPPILSVLRGADVGDIVIVVTRYFGGTKLGTGGLVRAYGDAARAALADMQTREKVDMRQLGLTFPYALYERIKLLSAEHHAEITGEDFGADVTVFVTMPLEDVDPFSAAVRDLSAGRVIPVALD